MRTITGLVGILLASQARAEENILDPQVEQVAKLLVASIPKEEHQRLVEHLDTNLVPYCAKQTNGIEEVCYHPGFGYIGSVTVTFDKEAIADILTASEYIVPEVLKWDCRIIHYEPKRPSFCPDEYILFPPPESGPCAFRPPYDEKFCGHIGEVITPEQTVVPASIHRLECIDEGLNRTIDYCSAFGEDYHIDFSRKELLKGQPMLDQRYRQALTAVEKELRK